MSRQIPAEFAVDGFIFRYKKHLVYWKELGNDDIGSLIAALSRVGSLCPIGVGSLRSRACCPPHNGVRG